MRLHPPRPCRRLLSLLLASVPACSTCPDEAGELLVRPDFSTPERAGQSFLAALGCDDAEAEYRCLSHALKKREGASYDLYLQARPRIREEAGLAVDYAYHADLVAREELGSSRTRLWYGRGSTPHVGLTFEQQHYWQFLMLDGSVVEDFLEQPPREFLKPGGRRRFRLDEIVFEVPRGFDTEQVRGVLLATEWKLGDVEAPPRP